MNASRKEAAKQLDYAAMTDTEMLAQLATMYDNLLERLNTHLIVGTGQDGQEPVGGALDAGVALAGKVKQLTMEFMTANELRDACQELPETVRALFDVDPDETPDQRNAVAEEHDDQPLDLACGMLSIALRELKELRTQIDVDRSRLDRHFALLEAPNRPHLVLIQGGRGDGA